MDTDSARLLDILNTCQYMQEFVAGMSYQDFLEDIKTQFAVRGAFQVIGEAVWQLSEQTRQQHPEIPWRDIVDMRHRIIHEYGRISWRIVWEVVHEDVPELMHHIRPLVPRKE